MPWTAPSTHTFATGEVVTASTLNTYLQNNMAFLGGTVGGIVTSAESTSSTTWTDLTTVGPSVTINTQTTALVMLYAEINVNVSSNVGYMGFAVSGASSIAATTSYCMYFESWGSSTVAQFSSLVYVTGLTAGSNIFTAKYQTNNTGGGSTTFAFRTIAVIPLGL